MRAWGAWSNMLWPSVLPALTRAKQPACFWTGPRAPVSFCRRDSVAFPKKQVSAGWSLSGAALLGHQAQLPAPHPTLTEL